MRKVLAVKYYSQRDSATNEALRMCYSSSNSMLLEYLKPGTLPGANGDDVYLRQLKALGGNTTNAEDQLKTLRHYLTGTRITVEFRQNLSFDDIRRQIDLNIPVSTGWLHHGPVRKPEGFGHWTEAIGYETDAAGNVIALIMHDPYGDPDLVNGRYLSTKGANLRFSRENFGPRWSPNGRNGWGIIAKRG